MARKDDSTHSGGMAEGLRQTRRKMKAAVAQLYDIAGFGLDEEAKEVIEEVASDLDEEQLKALDHLAELTVPRDYIEAMRQGLLRELKFNGEWLADQAKEANKGLTAVENPGWHHPDERPRDGESFDPFECIGGPFDYCHLTTDCLHDLQGAPSAPDGAVRLVGEAGGLKHMVMAAGHDRTEKHLSEVEFGGPEAVKAAEFVAWTAREAQRLEAEAVAQAEREKVAA